jgi:Tfp pilus assembly protein PilF
MTPYNQMAEAQFQQGLSIAQQALMAEQSMGNLPAAAQGYDQAIGLMFNALNSVVQPSDGALFNYAVCQFNAARVKVALGLGQFAPMHLGQAHEALAQAIGQNPGYFIYHSAMGMVLVGEGNASLAEQAFKRALQLNPSDSWSQWMLASLCATRGNGKSARTYYAAALQAQPDLPEPSGMSGGRRDKAEHANWMDVFVEGAKLLNNAYDAFSADQTQGQSEGGNGSNW